MRRATPEDIYNFNFVHDPTISQDGKQVLFTVTRAKGPDDYTSSIWKYADGHATSLISGDRLSNPVFTKKGDRFLYLSSSSDGSQELWISDQAGLDRRQMLRLEKRKISNSRWSRDEKSVFFLSDYDPTRVSKTDVRLINRMNYRFDGGGYLHDRRMHVFEVFLEDGLVRQVTKGEFDVAAFDLSPDGKTVAFVSNLDKDAGFQNNFDIFTVLTTGGEISKLTNNKGSMTS